MEPLDHIKLSKASSVLIEEIQSHGQVPTMGQDFSEFRRLIEPLHDRKISDQFNLDYETLKPAEAFWIVSLGHNGDLLAAVAAKLENIAPLSAAEYWQLHLPRVYRENAGGPVSFDGLQSRAAQSLKGRLVYLGDAYVTPALRKSGLAPAMGQLAQLAALGLWSFDTVYAFIHNAGVTRGMSATHGFRHQHHMPIRWRTAPSQFRPDNWLVYNHRDDVLDLIDLLFESSQREYKA